MNSDKYCNDYGDAVDCLKTPDESYTMSFEDVGLPPILWCSRCGAKAAALDKAITEAFADRGTEFLEEFERAVVVAERSLVRS